MLEAHYEVSRGMRQPATYARSLGFDGAERADAERIRPAAALLG